MKIISYVGAEGESIVIQKPQDLYPLLDWFQTQLIELGMEEESFKINKFMELAEAEGLGCYEDIEAVES